MKKNYTIRLEPEVMEALKERTGAPFTHAAEALIKSFLDGSELKVVQVPEENIYILSYRPK